MAEKSRRRKYSSSSDSSVDSAENERKKDLRERDEFAHRLRQKDESHTRKVLEVNYNVFIKCPPDYFTFCFWLHNRLRIRKALRKLPSVSNWSLKIAIKLCHIFVCSHAGHIWKNVKRIKQLSLKPILLMMNTYSSLHSTNFYLFILLVKC